MIEVGPFLAFGAELLGYDSDARSSDRDGDLPLRRRILKSGGQVTDEGSKDRCSVGT